ncbi:MAG: archaeosortase/exosortase family protein, partial [Martelella sp.]
MTILEQQEQNADKVRGRWGWVLAFGVLLIVLSLILLLLGSASLVAGRDGLRATWAPALFLIFAFPIPATVVNSVIWPLQLQTASNASSFLGLIGDS